MLDVHVLGVVRASTDGADHPLGGAKQRALLALLVIARGRPVSSDHLISEIWEEEPPRDPAHALQARVSRLRAALPIEIDLLDGGYRVDPAVIQTDSARFQSLCDHGGLLLADGAFAQAAECFHSALELWRGGAFAGLQGFTALRVESAKLERMRAAALSDRIDLDLTLGLCSTVVPELHALVEEQPFAERYWGQLMTALYCDDRAKEALSAFADARTAFAEGLGVEPSSNLGRLHVKILREHPPESLLRLSSRAGERGARYEEAAASDTAPAGPLTSNQPEILFASLSVRRALMLTGPAGIGKTHLLRAASAHFEAHRFFAPILTASSLSQSVPLGVFAGAGRFLPHEWTSPAALIDQYTRHRSKTVLLVDNVDQLDEASLFVVAQLIRTSRIPAILTSRDLTEAPDEIRSLYDSGDMTEVVVNCLTAADADELGTQILSGPLTPAARSRIFDAARGNPLHLREVITASRDEGRLVQNGPAWELRGDPASTPRLTQLVGERFQCLDDDGLEAAAKVAIAGEYPAEVLGKAACRALARAGVVEYSTHGWLRLAHPLDAEILSARLSAVLWHDLTNEVIQVLLSDITQDWPVARRRAHILALDNDEPIDVGATIAVAGHALGMFDERLALRAAQAVVAQEPTSTEGHRILGLAASSLGLLDQADASFTQADAHAESAAERTAVALARARHLGVSLHDAAGALAVVQVALETVADPDEAAHLRRDAVRWAVTAGQGIDAVGVPDGSHDAAATLGLITAAMSGVITGPLTDTETALALLRRVPVEVIQTVPGGTALIELTTVMAISNTGDMAATRHRLLGLISDAEGQGAASLGAWEYALGLSELLSGDAERAYALGVSASAHLEWRDITGLLPAARALAGAAAHATNRPDAAASHFKAIPSAADLDPKVVMLRAWAEAWQQKVADRRGQSSRILIDTARWLLAAQHTYFAAVLAHCAVRVGEDLSDAVAIIDEANSIAGGGLVNMIAIHGTATVAGDVAALRRIAADAQELGMLTTAADTWLSLARGASKGGEDEFRVHHLRLAADELLGKVPGMALWAQPT